MTNFDGVIYNASLTGIRYDYKPGREMCIRDRAMGLRRTCDEER